MRPELLTTAMAETAWTVVPLLAAAIAAQVLDALTLHRAIRGGVPVEWELSPVGRRVYRAGGLLGVLTLKVAVVAVGGAVAVVECGGGLPIVGVCLIVLMVALGLIGAVGNCLTARSIN